MSFSYLAWAMLAFVWARKGMCVRRGECQQRDPVPTQGGKRARPKYQLTWTTYGYSSFCSKFYLCLYSCCLLVEATLFAAACFLLVKEGKVALFKLIEEFFLAYFLLYVFARVAGKVNAEDAHFIADAFYGGRFAAEFFHQRFVFIVIGGGVRLTFRFCCHEYNVYRYRQCWKRSALFKCA